MAHFSLTVFEIMEIAVYSFLLLAGIFAAYILVLYILDKNQTNSTLRRNYPVIARFRYFFEHLGGFFRQYMFANDREEMPFNRAERSWIYRAAKNVDRAIPFGSTKDLTKKGAIFFLNCAFPVIQKDATKIKSIEIGPYCKKPYKASSFFNISAMSYGSISIPAVKALSLGAKQAGIWLNTGEGGLSKYHLEGGADIVFQIGTAKFGVCTKSGKLDEKRLKKIASHKEVKMFEIKLSQGAKPGKGGILPAAKVTKEIAEIRGIEEGKAAISPNRHPEIEKISDLIDMVERVRSISQKPVGFKIVAGSFDFFEDLCKEIKKRGIESAPDFITIDSADGGTGAAPASLMDSVGMPIKESLPKVVDIIKKHRLRDRIKICASGKLTNPTEVAWALCVGADFVNSARGFMFALGCIQALQCNKNTCPTGITTHDKSLQFGLVPQEKSQRVANYVKNMEEEVSMIAHSCGLKNLRQFNRKHARIVTGAGKSEVIEKYYK